MSMFRRGSSLAVMLLCGLALTACGSDSQDNAQPSATKDSVSPQASPPPTPSAATIPSPSSTDTSVESLGEQMGAKIAFYAVAKAAGMTESAKMDELAAGICSRIGSGKPEDVGPWMKDSFKLEGDVAAKVAVTAIEVQCPEFKSRMGL